VRAGSAPCNLTPPWAQGNVRLRNVANILVYIELDGERPLPASLEALALGRVIASTLGATNYALLPCAARPSYGDDDAIAVVSRHGADKVLLITHPTLAGPPLYATHGPVVMGACLALPPTLVLMASTPGSRDVAPRLAAQLAAAYLAEPQIEIDEDGGLTLTRTVCGGRYVRRLRTQDLERPVIVTLDPGRSLELRGDEEAEVVVLPPSASARRSPSRARARRAGAVRPGAGRRRRRRGPRPRGLRRGPAARRRARR